jgi:hypothetical protein
VDRRGGGPLEDRGDAARVVVVPVREQDGVRGLEGDAQRVGVREESELLFDPRAPPAA